jgi:pimeloyl-ACP methyl ester carboxylesterase
VTLPLFPLTASVRVAGTLVDEVVTELAPFQPDRPRATLERQYANAASEFVEVDDARVHYRTEGPEDAPTLLLVHGSYSSLHTWDGWVDELADEFHVVRLDMPGFGLTGPREDGEHSLEYLVDALARFCETVGIEETAVAGNSLGGAVAWRMATERPDLVSRLVLVDAGGASMLSTLARNYRLFGTDVVPRYVTPRIVVRVLLRDAYGDPELVTNDLVDRYHDLLLRRGNRRAVVEVAKSYFRDHVESHDLGLPVDTPALPSVTTSTPTIYDDHRLADIEAPTLFQWGEDDDWLPVEFGRELAQQVPDRRFETYDGLGHVPMEEAPERTAADAADFLRA